MSQLQQWVVGRLRHLSWIQLWNQRCAVVGSLTEDRVTVACYSFLVHVKGEFIRGDVEDEKPHFSTACGRWCRALQGMDERAPLGSAWFRFVFESNSSPANLSGYSGRRRGAESVLREAAPDAEAMAIGRHSTATKRCCNYIGAMGQRLHAAVLCAAALHSTHAPSTKLHHPSHIVVHGEHVDSNHKEQRRQRPLPPVGVEYKHSRRHC